MVEKIFFFSILAGSIGWVARYFILILRKPKKQVFTGCASCGSADECSKKESA